MADPDVTLHIFTNTNGILHRKQDIRLPCLSWVFAGSWSHHDNAGPHVELVLWLEDGPVRDVVNSVVCLLPLSRYCTIRYTVMHINSNFL